MNDIICICPYCNKEVRLGEEPIDMFGEIIPHNECYLKEKEKYKGMGITFFGCKIKNVYFDPCLLSSRIISFNPIDGWFYFKGNKKFQSNDGKNFKEVSKISNK